jgi:hypothetical protein
MEKKVIGLLGVSCFLVIAGIVLYLWSLFDSSAGSVAGTLPILLIIVGALGLNISWILHDVVERLMRLERGREEKVPSAKTREAELAAADDRLRD